MACMDVKLKGLAVNCGAGGWGAGSFEWINELTQRSVSDGKGIVKEKCELKEQRGRRTSWLALRSGGLLHRRPQFCR
jgi:hypothetical protein